jgi:predicted ATPase
MHVLPSPSMMSRASRPLSLTVPQRFVRAELIFQRGTVPDAEYTFKHALVQDAAYDSLR